MTTVRMYEVAFRRTFSDGRARTSGGATGRVGTVMGVRGVFAGHYDPASGEIKAASADDVAKCLPHNYKKAFRRALFWYGERAGGCDLKTRRGRIIGRVTVTPYDFDPVANVSHPFDPVAYQLAH